MARKTQQHELIAIEKGVKSEAAKAETALYHFFQKSNLYHGVQRDYTPKDDDGERLPSEGQLVQRSLQEDLIAFSDALERRIDVAASKDNTNRDAIADIVVGDAVLAKDVPVSTLLYLEKQMTDLRTALAKIPVLPRDKRWTFDETSRTFCSDTVTSNRTQKLPEVVVKYEATEHHAAQTEVFMKDVIVGTWNTTHESSAYPEHRRNEMMRRVGELIAAIKQARERANTVEVKDLKIGRALLNFINLDIES